LWSAVAEVTSILLPPATVGMVFGVSRKTSSVMSRSGVNTTCSVPSTRLWSADTLKVSVIFGRFGSGAA
jgi:hypothetical protein